MAVVVETTIGDFTIDLYTEERPRTCLNFLKLCKQKYYNLQLIYSIERNFVAQMGDPTGTGRGGDSIFKSMFGDLARLYEGEKLPVMKHTEMGTVSMVDYGKKMYGSQLFVTLGDHLDSLDDEHLVFGRVTEGLDVIAKFNEVLSDEKNRPYQDIRISHTVVLDDPFPDPDELEFPDESPRVTAEVLASDYIAVDESVDDMKDKDMAEIQEEIAAKEAEAQATILEMVGDLPDAHMAPPENVLFVCKLNPVTTSEDLEIIFSRFGKIVCAEVIKDRLTGNSLQYAFIEFDNKKSCEDAYFKMDNVLIDDRRIHVDFSQSVSKIQWRGKGRGVDLFDDKGRKVSRNKKDELFKHKSSRHDSNKAGEPKSRFIDTAAYGKQYDERQQRNRADNPNWRNRNGDRDRKAYYGDHRRDGRRDNIDRDDDTERRDDTDRRGEDRERRNTRRDEKSDEADRDRNDSTRNKTDYRNERPIIHASRNDLNNSSKDLRNDRHKRQDRGRDRRDERELDKRHALGEDKEQREHGDDPHRRGRDDDPVDSYSVPTEESKRRKLIDHLRAEVKNVAGKDCKYSSSSDSDDSDSSDSDHNRKKKKKLKKKKKKANKKHVESTDSESPKKNKSKHKKRSTNSDSESDLRKKSKKSKMSKKSKH